MIGSELQLALCQLPAHALFNVIDLAHYKYNSSVFNFSWVDLKLTVKNVCDVINTEQ